MRVLITKIINYLYAEAHFGKLGRQKSVSLKPSFSLMSYLNVLTYCFYHKPHEILTSSVTDSVDMNQNKIYIKWYSKIKSLFAQLTG